MATVLIDEFIRCGVRHACISPGSRSAPLALAVAARPELTHHVILDERSAAFFALGIAKTTGVPALLLCTSGTAAANFLPAVHEADRAGVPFLVLTADRPPELRGTGANQATDQIKIYSDAVRWFVEVGAPEALPVSNKYWRSVAARSFISAKVERGPVHLNVAFREPLVPVDDGEPFPFDLEGRAGSAPWHEQFTSGVRIPDAVIKRISAAERGVVVAGHLEDGGERVAELARGLGWPLVAEATSNARHPGMSVDHYDLILESAGFGGSHGPDLVLRFGSAGLSKSLARFLTFSPQILVDDSIIWLDAARSAEFRVRASAREACDSILTGMTPTSFPPEWSKGWQRASELARAVIEEELATEFLSDPQAARTTIAACPPGSLVLVGASMPIRDVDNFSAARSDIHLLGNRGLNGIDGFNSTALGVAAASGRPTYALCGELTFLHEQGGILDAPLREVRLTYVVLNNNGGGIFSFLPQAELPEHFEEVFGTPQAVDLARLCSAHGIEHQIVGKAPALAELLSKPIRGIRVIEIRTERSANVALHQRLRARVKETLNESFG
ncbi:MAG: 2-succinyl-5-enolpyruvyl-6-hydroxy-3-cyclohexene-1-carboxylic-acid synthase [Actinomycetota bacterium]